MQNPDVSLKDFISKSDLIKNQEQIGVCVQNGRSLQKTLGVSTAKIDRIYKLGHQMLVDEQVGDASNIFSYILVVQSFDARVWKSLGISFSREGKQSAAIECFAIASLIDSNNAENYFWLAACSWLMEEWEDARRSLVLAASRDTAGKLTPLISKAQKALEGRDLELLGEVYHEQFYRRLESLALETVDPILEREDRQRAIYVRIKHKTQQCEVDGGFPVQLCAFYNRLNDQFEGNLVAFSLGFLSKS